MFKAFLIVVCGLFIVACNYTDGACYERGQGGQVAGVGGGPIVPGQGGFGDVPPEPQGAGDANDADPCNAGAGRDFTCNGSIVCYEPNPGAGASGMSATGCFFAVRRYVAASADKLIADLIKKCQSENPKYACENDDLVCTDVPAKRYVCNGGIGCIDDKNNHDGCTVGGEPTDPFSSIAGNVYAHDETEAINHLADICEVLKHDKYGTNCAHKGMCCVPSSVTCQKQ